MNSLYTLILRQSTSLASDFDTLESQARSGNLPRPGASVDVAIPINGHAIAGGSSGSATVSKTGTDLTQLSRTLGDYEKMAQAEMVEAKRLKAQQRARQLRSEIEALQERHKRLKTFESSSRTDADRSVFNSNITSSSIDNTNASSSATSSSTSYLSPSGTSSASPYSNPHQQLHARSYSGTPQASSSPSTSYPPRPYGQQQQQQSAYGNPYASSGYESRTHSALDEHSFLTNTGTVLDDYIAQGKAVLDNLGTQRDIMKGTQRRLLSAANTLGLSRETIHFIEKRTKADFILLLVGATVTIGLMVLILHYLG